MKDSHSKKFNLTILTFALILATSLAHSTTHVPLLTETIMKKIFNSCKFFNLTRRLIHGHLRMRITEPLSLWTFFWLLLRTLLCILGCNFLIKFKKNNELYDSIKNFVGHPHDEYFLILDAPRQEKYVLEIKDKDIKCNKLTKLRQGHLQFRSWFHQPKT